MFGVGRDKGWRIGSVGWLFWVVGGIVFVYVWVLGGLGRGFFFCLELRRGLLKVVFGFFICVVFRIVVNVEVVD